MPDRQRPTRSPWRHAMHHWLARRHTDSASHTLRRHNIYFMPTPAGCLLALTLLMLLLVSINFQLNLGYALTFLIAGSALASLWMGYRNVHGVQLRLGPLHPVFQGSRATVPVQLEMAYGQRPRYALSLAMNRSHGPLAWVHADMLPGQTQTVVLSSIPHQRGWHRVPRVVIESRFPLGVFRLWSYWQPSARILVYPTPENPIPPIQWNDPSPHGLLATSHTQTDRKSVV